MFITCLVSRALNCCVHAFCFLWLCSLFFCFPVLVAVFVSLTPYWPDLSGSELGILCKKSKVGKWILDPLQVWARLSVPCPERLPLLVGLVGTHAHEMPCVLQQLLTSYEEEAGVLGNKAGTVGEPGQGRLLGCTA